MARDPIEKLAANVRRLLKLHIQGWSSDLEDHFPDDGRTGDYAVPGMRFRRPAVRDEDRVEGDDDLAAYDLQEYADDDGPEATPPGTPPPDPTTTYVFLNRCPLFTARVYSTPDPDGTILMEFFAITRFPPGAFERPAGEPANPDEDAAIAGKRVRLPSSDPVLHPCLRECLERVTAYLNEDEQGAVPLEHRLRILPWENLGDIPAEQDPPDATYGPPADWLATLSVDDPAE